ncbi:hypothetical protein [Chryseobacterium sp. M5A1_1a]
MNDSRELSLVQACQECSTSFSAGRTVKDREANNENFSNIGTLYFANTKGILFDDVNDFESDILEKQLNTNQLKNTSKINSPTSALGHDMAHAYDFTINTNRTTKTNGYQLKVNDISTQKGSPYFKNMQEKFATGISTKININLKENPRNNHRGTDVKTTGVLSNKMYKIFLCLLLLMLTFSCKPKNNIITNSSKIKVIKFMGVDMYSTEIDKKKFWIYEDEHMFLFMKKAGFLSEIERYKELENSSLKEYAYAFVTPRDTLYSDYSLKSWILIRNKKERYYYDEQGKTSEFLRKVYPFFRDCPYVSDAN